MEPTSILIIGGVIAGILLILGLIVSISEEPRWIEGKAVIRRSGRDAP